VFFLGGGNMATAIIAGIDRKAWHVIVCEIYEPQRKKLEATFSLDCVDSAEKKIEQAHVVLFAVKPQQLPGVLEKLRGVNLSNKTVISIMAGVPLSALKANLTGTGIKFVRTMPNMPLMVGQGVTGVYLEKGVDAKLTLEELLGKTSELYFFDSEELLNSVTALSGSGPAYFFAFMEALREAGEAMGIPRDIATRMAIGTALGASTLAKESTDDIATLRANVTSKGGTTERALATFSERGLNRAVKDACFAALKRAEELEEAAKAPPPVSGSKAKL